MINWNIVSINEYYNMNVKNKSYGNLFFINETGSIFRGSEIFKENMIIYSSNRMPKNHLDKCIYINDKSLEGYVWSGRWVKIISNAYPNIYDNDDSDIIDRIFLNNDELNILYTDGENENININNILLLIERNNSSINILYSIFNSEKKKKNININNIIRKIDILDDELIIYFKKSDYFLKIYAKNINKYDNKLIITGNKFINDCFIHNDYWYDYMSKMYVINIDITANEFNKIIYKKINNIISSITSKKYKNSIEYSVARDSVSDTHINKNDCSEDSNSIVSSSVKPSVLSIRTTRIKSTKPSVLSISPTREKDTEYEKIHRSYKSQSTYGNSSNMSRANNKNPDMDSILKNKMDKLGGGHNEEIIIADVDGNALASGVRIKKAQSGAPSNNYILSEKGLINYMDKNLINKNSISNSLIVPDNSESASDDKPISEKASLQLLEISIIK